MFDSDESGTLDINEYMHAISIHDNSTPNDKVRIEIFLFFIIKTSLFQLNWIFSAFDADGGGSIDVEELKWDNVFKKIYFLFRDLLIGLFQLAGLPDDPDQLVACYQEIK